MYLRSYKTKPPLCAGLTKSCVNPLQFVNREDSLTLEERPVGRILTSSCWPQILEGLMYQQLLAFTRKDAAGDIWEQT